jgi:AcrR family transcriptional regulator
VPRKPGASKSLSKGGRPRKTTLEARERRIREQSAKLFIQHGFTAVSMDAIAKAARVAKQTLYDNFGDKADIFLAVIRERADRLVTFEPNVLENTSDIEVILNIVAHQLVDYCLKPESVALERVIAAESQRFPEFMQTVIDESDTRLLDGVARLFDDLAKRGLLIIEDPRQDAQVFVHLIVGLHALLSIMGAPNRPTEDEIKKKVRVFLRSYAANDYLERQETADKKGKTAARHR